MHLGLLTKRPGHFSVCRASLAGCMRRHASAYALHAQDAKCIWACSAFVRKLGLSRQASVGTVQCAWFCQQLPASACHSYTVRELGLSITSQRRH